MINNKLPKYWCNSLQAQFSARNIRKKEGKKAGKKERQREKERKKVEHYFVLFIFLSLDKVQNPKKLFREGYKALFYLLLFIFSVVAKQG